MCQLKRPNDPRILVGIDTADDAGVYLLNETTALIQTLDFFTPIVDDPYLFGQIAAANSLSDVYAMGGQPLTAMNIVAFPIGKLPPTVLQEILRGGQEKVQEAGALLLGGHTVEDNEPKYGLSVTGVAEPAAIWKNAGAQSGDCLILTKPLGTGVLATAARADLFPAGVQAAVQSMATLNKTAAAVLRRYTVHACTDITGFGLIGHAQEMAKASEVRLRLQHASLPLLPEALEAARMGLVPAGAYHNREYVTGVTFAAEVAEAWRDLCFDPQTSGGLLVSIPAAEAAAAVAELKAAGVSAAAVIGTVGEKGRGEIDVD